MSLKDIEESNARWNNRNGAREPIGSNGEQSNSKPPVRIPGSHGNGREVGAHEFADMVLKNLPRGLLYRMGRVVGSIVGESGSREFRPLTDQAMRLIIDERLRLTLTVKRKDGFDNIFRTCTRDWAGLVIEAAQESPSVRVLRALLSYPVYGPGFKLVKPGWNECGIYYDEPAELAGLEPRDVYGLDLAAHLAEYVVDFPFRDEASRQNTYGLWLTPILRPAIAGNIPMHLIKASLERTGKGLLIESSLGAGIIGKSVPTMQLGRDEAEHDKRILALILRGTTVAHLDNLATADTLDSAPLASLLTARTYSGRKLGKSEFLDLPNEMTLVASGNNPKASGELCKRTVPITLQATTDTPQDRADFAHPDAPAFFKEHRRELLAVLLGMVQEWISMGQLDGLKRLGGFENWAAVIGGIMEASGLKHWLGNYKEWVRSGDEWSADAESLCEVWDAQNYTTGVSAKTVFALAEANELFPEVLARPTAGQMVAFSKRVLRVLVDRPIKHWRVKAQSYGSNTLYQLTREP